MQKCPIFGHFIVAEGNFFYYGRKACGFPNDYTNFFFLKEKVTKRSKKLAVLSLKFTKKLWREPLPTLDFPAENCVEPRGWFPSKKTKLMRALARLKTIANLYTVTLRRGSAQFLRWNRAEIRDGSRIAVLPACANKAIKLQVFLLLLPRLFFQTKKSANIIISKIVFKRFLFPKIPKERL